MSTCGASRGQKAPASCGTLHWTVPLRERKGSTSIHPFMSQRQWGPCHQLKPGDVSWQPKQSPFSQSGQCPSDLKLVGGGLRRREERDQRREEWWGRRTEWKSGVRYIWAVLTLSCTSGLCLHSCCITQTHTFNLRLVLSQLWLWHGDACSVYTYKLLVMSLPDWDCRTEVQMKLFISEMWHPAWPLPPGLQIEPPVSQSVMCSLSSHGYSMNTDLLCHLSVCWFPPLRFSFYHSYHSRRRTASTTSLHQSSKVWKIEAEVSSCLSGDGPTQISQHQCSSEWWYFL